MKRLVELAVLLACVVSTGVSCDNVDEYIAPQPYAIDWNAAADSATTALIQNFWNAEKGFFKSTTVEDGGYNYWPQAHAMDVVIDAYLRTSDSKYSDMFGRWFEGCKLQNHGDLSVYTNDYYDDEAWIALTMTRLYKVTKEEKYLTVAKSLYDDIMNGWNPANQDGGLSWRKSQPDTKNSCINGPGATLAFKLYEATGDESYAQQGLKVYEWTREHLMDPATGAVVDGINGETGEITAWRFSYNQGTVMAAAYQAYKYTDNALYLKDARRLAYYTINSNSFIDQATNVILKENGGKPGNGDDALFRAVFFRYFADIIEAPDFDEAWHNKFLACMNSSSEYLWRYGLADRREFKWMLFSGDWQNGVSVGEVGYLNPNVSAASCIEMRARIEAAGK